MQGLNKFLLRLLFFVSFGCFAGMAIMSCSVGEKDVRKFLSNPENGFRSVKNMQGLELSVTYQPASWLAQQEALRDSSLKQDSLWKVYNESVQMVLEFGAKGEEGFNKQAIAAMGFASIEEFNAAVMEYAYGMEKSLFILNGQDTVYARMYLYERGFELGKKERLVYVFPKTKLERKFKVAFYDKVLGLGLTQFELEPDWDAFPIPQMAEAKIN